MRKMKKIMADNLTMITAFLRLSGAKKCLLENTPRDKANGRHSIIAVNPVHEIYGTGTQLTIDEQELITDDPLKTLDEFIVRKGSDEDSLPFPFEAGAIGYIGFDMFGFYEKLPNPPHDELGIPDIHFYVYESFLVVDHTNEHMILVQDNVYSGRNEAELEQALAQMERELKTPSPLEQREVGLGPLDFKSNVTKSEYENMVKRAKQHINEGDLFQMVPSQRLSADFPYNPFDYYRKLRLSNPSAYLYYLDFGKTKVIGSSPESLVSVKGRTVLTNPIAGTRKRGKTVEEDHALVEELLHDEKELAEHRILVDLGRNDLGKISEIGSVAVPIYLTVEKYRFVMHLVSVVIGKLKETVTAMDALKAAFPAGTVSGAPKIRAIQRIYEIEPVRRNLYAGAVGYLTKNDQADFAIAIRTMVLVNGVAHVQAGAGVVYDSDPEKEYFESLQKAKALLEVAD